MVSRILLQKTDAFQLSSRSSIPGALGLRLCLDGRGGRRHMSLFADGNSRLAEREDFAYFDCWNLGRL
jgi:hypothetical protein